MKRLFIEAEGFRKKVDTIGGPSLLAGIQSEILKNPNNGKMISRLAGVRKMRMGDMTRGKDKRGGFRVLYLDLPEREKTYLLWIYSKNESENISEDEKRIIKNLASDLKREGE